MFDRKTHLITLVKVQNFQNPELNKLKLLNLLDAYKKKIFHV